MAFFLLTFVKKKNSLNTRESFNFFEELCMNTVVHGVEYCVVERNPVGRIGDYSQMSALFVGLYKKKGEDFRRVSVNTMIDEPERWNAPHPKFTSSGGHSQKVLHHLRHIFYAHQKDDQKKVLFLDDVGNRFFLFMLMSGDVLVGTEGSDFDQESSFLLKKAIFCITILRCLRN